VSLYPWKDSKDHIQQAARVFSANASVSDGIGNRGIVSLLPLASCGTFYGRPAAQRQPPEQDVCLSLRER